MSRVIFKCPYLKGGGGTQGHRANFVMYIATRPGVQKIDDTKKLLPETRKQRELIAAILRDFPETEDMFEHEDYLANPTRGNASEFITVALEQNLHRMDKRENYVKYIANRPRTERMGGHGLFTAPGTAIVLKQVAEDVAKHPGNVWLPIFSLRREDAERLGYDSAQSWMSLLSSYAVDMARAMQIQPANFRWYAAFHDEGHHPHVHMVCYSTHPSEGFLTKDGIRKLKSGLASRIFRQELTELYAAQTRHRDDTAAQSRARMGRLVAQMRSGILEDEQLEVRVAELSQRLALLSGKKQYGYLPASLKGMVDEIVDRLAQDDRVAEAYRMWCELRMEVLRTYTKNPPPPGPLSQQKEFKHIRNMVIQEAGKFADVALAFERDGDGAAQPDELDGGESTPPDEPEGAGERPPCVVWSGQYLLAKDYLHGSGDVPRDVAEALRLLGEEATAGNALAMCDLARMYADGIGTEPEADVARDWYAKALAAFHAVEREKPWRYTQYRIGKLYAGGLGVEQDYGKAAEWLAQSAAQKYKYAEYSLAGLYREGKGVEQNMETAFGLYAAAAKRGFAYASFALGKMCREGVGTQLDVEAAQHHFKQAYCGFCQMEKQSADDKVLYRLGNMLEKGIGTAANLPAAIAYYQRAAELKNPHAQYRLARLFLDDANSTAEQIAQAIRWLTSAAAQGNPYAQYALGKMYVEGIHAGKDIPRAAGLFEQAAEQGNQYAQYQLGKLLMSGDGIPKDLDRAVRLLTASAEQGNQYAQYRLGKLFLRGEEIPCDRDAAKRWLTLSAAQGNEYAQFFLDNFDSFKDPSVLRAGTRLLRHLGNIFRDNPPSKPPRGAGGMGIDRKLLRKQWEKKVAMGHAKDDRTPEVGV